MADTLHAPTFSARSYTRRTLLRGAGIVVVAGAGLALPRFGAIAAPASGFAPPAPIAFVDSIGPEDGEIRFDTTDSGYRLKRYFLDATDVVMNATFRNPYDASKGVFSYGFRFRMVGERCTNVYVTSSGIWSRSVFDDNGDSIPAKRFTGSVINMRTGANDTNDVQVIVTGDVAELLVNGVSVAAFRLDEIVSGNVAVSTNNVITKATVTDAVTRYTGFYAAPPPPPSMNAQRARAYLYGPATGGVPHNTKNDAYEDIDTGLQLRDGIVNARFFVPYNDPNVGWDMGFVMRDTDTQQVRLALAASRQYFVTLGTRPNNKADWTYRTVQSGTLNGLRTGAGDFNDVEMTLNGSSGTLSINGVGISERLDLSGAPNPGGFTIATGLRTNDEKAGAITRYENFTVAPLPPR